MAGTLGRLGMSLGMAHVLSAARTPQLTGICDPVGRGAREIGLRKTSGREAMRILAPIDEGAGPTPADPACDEPACPELVEEADPTNP